MSGWTETDLHAVGSADELKLASVRSDGTLRPYVSIWVVRAGDDLYVRSAYGPENGWFRRARSSGVGRIRAGVVERDVTFADAPGGVHPAIDAAYQAKYDRYGERSVRALGDLLTEEDVRKVWRPSPRSPPGQGGWAIGDACMKRG